MTLSPVWTCALAVVASAVLAQSGADDKPAEQPGGMAEVEAQFEQAIARGDFGAAKALDIELSQTTSYKPQATSRNAEPEVGLFPDFIGPDYVVDTVAAAAFGAATDDSGTIWVAVAGRDTRVRVYRSFDFGRTWSSVLWFGLGADVSKVEVVYGPGDSSFIYVFYLAALNDGDLRVMRIQPGGKSWDSPRLPANRQAQSGTVPDFQDFAVAVGPDTVNDFSVCADRDQHYYIYCLYANEMRAGRTGSFTRSLDFSKSWEAPQPWWNCWDPRVTYGSGSTIHCVWRYAGTGREIDFETSRYYGRVRQWWPVHIVSGTGQKCWDPVVAQADTADEWQATIWVSYTVARRDTERLDVEVSRSPDGGWNWATGQAVGDPVQDDWFPDLHAFPGSAPGYVYLCYNSGGRGANDNTTVRFRSANALDPDVWSRPLKMSDPRANALFEGCRPRVVCPKGAPRQWAGTLFSYYSPDYGSGLYFDAPWNRGGSTHGEVQSTRCKVQNGGSRFSVTVTRGGVYTLMVYDHLGRPVRTVYSGRLEPAEHQFEWDGNDKRGLPVPSGAYFVLLRGPDTRCRGRFVVLR